MKSIKKLGAIFALGSMTAFANAGVIVGAQSVWTDGASYNFDAGNIINQSGLSQTYVSGVDDYDSFVSSVTACYGCLDALGYSNYGDQLGDNSGRYDDFYFDLGSEMSVSSIAVWQQAGSATLSSFDLYASVDGVSKSQLLGSYLTPQNSFQLGGLAYDFSYGSVDTRYLIMDVTGNQGFSYATRLNEVAFEASQVSVSEPASLALLGLGVLGLGVARRKQA